MAETSSASVSTGTGSSQRGGNRGNRRGFWRRRNRGGRGGAASPLTTADATTTQGSQSAQTEQQQQQQQPVPNAPQPVRAPRPAAESDTTSQNGQSVRGGRSARGGRGGTGGRRGRGGAAQRSIVSSHRGGRGPPVDAQTAESQSQLASNASGLNAVAAEFVPGHSAPVAPRSQAPSSRAPRSRPPRLAPASTPIQKSREKSTAEDLPTRIHEDIDNGQYECVICTNEVVRSSKVWSCTICWTVLHLHCVKKWYTNQMKEKQENPGPQQTEGWRCPGCNSTLEEEPGSYHCWCGKDFDMKPISGLPPHTCGQTCSKPRATCPHPCPLMCHAGPCPPCTLMGPTQACFCGKNAVTKRCNETDYGKGWSCQQECGDILPCGEHTCSQPCHAGLCGACEIPVPSVCYCGKERRVITCDKREDIIESFNYGQLQPSKDEPDIETESWFEGSFRCQRSCGRPFDCGKHRCEKQCHPQDEEIAPCPFSPNVVTHCPCGKTPLDSMSAPARSSCEDPVPHCDKPCNKTLPCGHFCQDKCHVGDCAPCFQYIDISCQCGKVTTKSVCHQGKMEHPQCFRTCRAHLNCGRHECGNRCCPGEKKATERKKQKRAAANENFEPEHICVQICGRQLKCGTHTCQQLCHRGPCMSCPEAIFDEISCSCGRTVLQPPQPCGTRPPECRYNCRRPRACGHPTVPHQCHPDEGDCPKCAFLVERSCICGKKTLKNQPCWFQDARCGLPCGKKLKCGLHVCTKPCHKPGECEDVGVPGSHCAQVCGKTMVSCEHTCADQCHAPYPCKENTPCQSKTFITCPCQRRKQEARCQATRFNPWPHRDTILKCDDECLRIQRNRLLADALKVDPESHKDEHIPYSDKTLKMFRDNVTWAQTQEREFRVFASTPDEKRLRFKPMQPHQRAFLHSLAEDYGLDSESQDPEGHRHVCVFKTPRFVAAPTKTLAQCWRILQANKPAPIVAEKAQPAVQAYNALLLTQPRFGLTVDEVEKELSKDLAAASRSGPALTFQISFVPTDEVIIRAVPNFTAAAIITSTPQTVESALTALKSSVAKTISRSGGIARNVILCHADGSLNILRREGTQDANAGGWNAVASRGAKRAAAAATSRASAGSSKVTLGGFGSGNRAGGAFVALRRLELKKKKEAETTAVVDDWEEAVEKELKEELEASGKDGADEATTSGSEGSEQREDKQSIIINDDNNNSSDKETEQDGKETGNEAHQQGGGGGQMAGEAQPISADA